MRGAEAAAWGGLFLFGLVVALLGAVLPLLSEPLGLDLAAAGGLLATLNAVILAGSTAFGFAVDRFGCRGALTGGALLIGLALVAVARAATPLALAGAVALLGFGGSAVNSASNALAADLYPEPRSRAAALNRIGVAFGLGALTLPLLIGALLDRLGLDRLLLVSAAVPLLVALHASLARLPPAKPEVLRPREAVALLRQPLLAVLGGLLFVEAGAETILSGYLSTFLVRETGAGVRAASTVLAASWGALMVARLLLGLLLLRVSTSSVLPWLAGAATVTVALVPLASGLAVAAALFVATAFVYSGIIPTVLAVAGSAEPRRTGTVLGMLVSVAVFGAMTVPWATGQLAATRGVGVVPLVGAAGFGAVTLLALAAGRLDSSRSARGVRSEGAASSQDAPRASA